MLHSCFFTFVDFFIFLFFLQDELEELKKKENESLQLALQEMEKQFQATKTLLMKERGESVKKAPEYVSNVQEVTILDDQLMAKITVENEQLKVMDLWFSCLVYYSWTHVYFSLNSFSIACQKLVSSLEKKIDETEKKFVETSKLNQIPLLDNELVNKLAAENEQLKVMCLL